MRCSTGKSGSRAWSVWISAVLSLLLLSVPMLFRAVHWAGNSIINIRRIYARNHTTMAFGMRPNHDVFMSSSNSTMRQRTVCHNFAAHEVWRRTRKRDKVSSVVGPPVPVPSPCAALSMAWFGVPFWWQFGLLLPASASVCPCGRTRSLFRRKKCASWMIF